MRIPDAISDTNQHLLGANDSGLSEFDNLLDNLLAPDRVIEASSSSRIQNSTEIRNVMPTSRPLGIASKEQRNGELLDSTTTSNRSESQNGVEQEGKSLTLKVFFFYVSSQPVIR